MVFRNPKFLRIQIPALAVLLPALAGAQVAFREAAGKIKIRMDGKPFSNLYYGSEWAKPFLHPLRSVSGAVVTRAYPVEEIEGENKDHKWHHGLWFAHGDINGVDFWRDLGPGKTGRMVVKGPPKASGGVLALEAELVAPDRRPLGAVAQEFRFSRSGANHTVDVRVAVRAARGVPLKMGDTEEGTFAVRLADEFREQRGVMMRNSAGESGRKIWGRRAKWVDYSAAVRGEKLGVLVMDHPSNPKHPTYWHARHYSLCSANPFGERDFLKDKTRDGSVPIPAGGKLDFRYRVVIHSGGLDESGLERLYNDYLREGAR